MLKIKMQSPTAVIISSIAAASGSRTNPSGSALSPKVNQVKFCTARNPFVCSVCRNATKDNASAATGPMTAIAAPLLRHGFGKLKMISDAANGAAGISQRQSVIELIKQLRARARVQDLSFELIELIDIGGVIMTIHGYNHRQTNRGFGSRDRDCKDREHHAGWLVRLRSETPECDEIQIRGRQHQLDTNQNENGVTATQCGKQANGKQCRRHDKKNLERRCHCCANRKSPTLNSDKSRAGVQRRTSNPEFLLN